MQTGYRLSHRNIAGLDLGVVFDLHCGAAGEEGSDAVDSVVCVIINGRFNVIFVCAWIMGFLRALFNVQSAETGIVGEVRISSISWPVLQ